jgi:hypothetical protein
MVTAANVNTYLQDQAVIGCTSSTRPASPAEPWMVAETDTDSLNVYDGTTWRRLPGMNWANATVLSVSRTTPLTVNVPALTPVLVSWGNILVNREGWLPLTGGFAPLVGGMFVAVSTFTTDSSYPTATEAMPWSTSAGGGFRFGVGLVGAGEAIGFGFVDLFPFDVTYTARMDIVRLSW